MEFKGKHAIIDVKLNKNMPPVKLKQIIKVAIKKTGATILGELEHYFKPDGYSLNILISESHASIHTYPEEKGIFLDYFTCGKIGVNKYIEYIISKLPIKAGNLIILERGTGLEENKEVYKLNPDGSKTHISEVRVNE